MSPNAAVKKLFFGSMRWVSNLIEMNGPPYWTVGAWQIGISESIDIPLQRCQDSANWHELWHSRMLWWHLNKLFSRDFLTLICLFFVSLAWIFFLHKIDWEHKTTSKDNCAVAPFDYGFGPRRSKFFLFLNPISFFCGEIIPIYSLQLGWLQLELVSYTKLAYTCPEAKFP